MNQQATPDQPAPDLAVARLYLKHKSAERVVVQIPQTNYELHLRPTGEVTPTPQGRVRGVIRCRVWKVDYVSAGGAFIEPIQGRPGLVQGRVIGASPETNSAIVEVAGTPIVGDLPDRWSAAQIPVGTRIGFDVYSGSTFEPVARSNPSGTAQQTTGGSAVHSV